MFLSTYGCLLAHLMAMFDTLLVYIKPTPSPPSPEKNTSTPALTQKLTNIFMLRILVSGVA
jgi:hypothetical protein